LDSYLLINILLCYNDYTYFYITKLSFFAHLNQLSDHLGNFRCRMYEGRMKRIKIWDKEFVRSLTYTDIKLAIQRMAREIRRDMEGKQVLFICILNGAFMFASELMKVVELTDSEITFLKLSSYSGTVSTGEVKELIGLNEAVEGRTIVILEDIVDTGNTVCQIHDQLVRKGATDVKIATLLFKPATFKINMDIAYVGFEIPNEFIVGFGLDYERRGRNLKDIYTLVNE
jgi:hypoxanthine phosphoribosyltransferase